MDPEHSASQPSSLSYGRNTVDSTKILINHKDKDSLCHTNISSSDVTVEEYSTSTSESCEDSASGRRASTGQAHNIPYMQHFHHLKQKFPDLKDCDINESIQKFGLDLARCEAELQQRAQSYLSGYYGPWGRGNLSSRSSPITTPSRNASLTSPNTPTLSPYPSPFSSQVLPSSRTMASSRSTPKLFSPKTTRNSPGPRESNTIPLCSPSSCVPSSQVTSSSMAFSSSLMPSLATTAGPAVYTPATIYAVTSNIKNNNTHGNQNVITSPSIHNGSSLARVPSSQADPYHTTTTRHYVGTSVHHNINEPFYRQYSNSSETITEESSLMGSNIPSPAPTLTFSSPQSPLVSPPSHNHCTDMPDLSRLLEQLPISQNASNHNQFHQPTNPYLPTWNQGNERAPNVSVLPNAQLLSYVDNDILYNRTREQAAQSGISTSSVNRENNSDAMYFSSPPEHNNPGGDKLALDPSEIRRRRPNLQSRLEPVRIAPPPPVSTSANIAPARQMSRLADLQLCTVSPPSFVPPPLPPSSSTAAGLNQPSAKIDNRKGMKHVASLHFVPSPPHNAHLVACPPSNGSVELSDRSYTSVNLRLRQPSSEPQPAIDIKGSGSCLTYSTSSLDRRQGSRSSLQISIGPSGGSISAMRTNLSTELERGNTAFHIQYRADDGPDQTPSSNAEEPASQAMPTDYNKPPQSQQVPESPTQSHPLVPPSPGDDRRKSTFNDKLSFSRSRSDRHSHDRTDKHANRLNRHSMPSFNPPRNIDSPVSNVQPELVLEDRLPPPSFSDLPLESPVTMRGKRNAFHERQSPFLHERLPFLLDDRGCDNSDPRPQSWYAAPSVMPIDSTGSSQYSSQGRLHATRRYSMPDGGQFAYLDPPEERRFRRHHRHGWYEVQGPPSSEHQPLSTDEWASGERIYVQGLLDDQRARQQRMLAVLTDGTKDRTSLQEEVSKLSHSLEEIRQKGIAEANRYAKLIHDIQEENRLLQSECDRFEGEILQTGEEPDLVETGYGAHFSNHREGPGFSLSSPSSPLPARPQPFNRGVSVGRGVTEGSQRFTPTRVAPPPPVSSAATPSAAPQFPSSGFESLPHQHAMGGNAASAPRWSCNRCTYDNHPDMTSCEICGAIRMPPSPHTPAGGFPRPSLGMETNYAETGSVSGSRSHAGRVHDTPDGWCYKDVNPGSCSRGVGSEVCFSKRGGNDGTVGVNSHDVIVATRAKQPVFEDTGLDGRPREREEFVSPSSHDVCEMANVRFEQVGGSICDFETSRVSAGGDIPVVSKRPDMNSGNLDLSVSETQLNLNQAISLDDRCSSDSSSKEGMKPLDSTRSKASSARNSQDDLDVFSFIAGISHGNWNSPRSRKSLGCSVSPFTPPHDHSSSSSECYCHPRRRSEVLGHRRTGSGGSAAVLGKSGSLTPLEHQRNFSSLSGLSVQPQDQSDAMGSLILRGNESRSSSDVHEILHTRGSERCVVGVSTTPDPIRSSYINSDVSNKSSLGSSEGGGSRSFGYDTTPLKGYPAALYYSARDEDGN
ncbi:Zinc finger RanBP2-type [Trinorchestia longiramus]|nr:Zinc finger RanBP2-type [Trinorchestia longiramus]